jgi:transcriptional regulator with XRE-family HTH domain
MNEAGGKGLDHETSRGAFGRRVKTLRENNGLSRRELASAVGVRDESSVRGWENGRHRPSEKYTLKLADIFGVAVSDLTANHPGDITIPTFVRIIDTHKELPGLLIDILRRTKHSIKAIRIAARYSTASGIQTDFRREVARRILDGTLVVERAEIFYDLSRFREVLANIIRYAGRGYRVKAYCPGLDEVVPGFGGYCFDDQDILFGAYWDRTPPPSHAPGLLLSGDPFREFFRAYWGEIWRRGVWLNEKGAHHLDAARRVAQRLGLRERDWPKFVEEARCLEIGDGAPPLI